MRHITANSCYKIHMSSSHFFIMFFFFIFQGIRFVHLVRTLKDNRNKNTNKWIERICVLAEFSDLVEASATQQFILWFFLTKNVLIEFVLCNFHHFGFEPYFGISLLLHTAHIDECLLTLYKWGFSWGIVGITFAVHYVLCNFSVRWMSLGKHASISQF